MKKVLVAEDEESIREFIVINLITVAATMLSRLKTVLLHLKNFHRMKMALMLRFLIL